MLRLLTLVFCSALAFSAAAEEFPKPYDTQKLEAPLLSPEEAATKFKLPDGFRATLFAGEPHVQQPIGMTTDDRGRLWVAENYTYSEAKVNFAKDQRDRIIILEDTDGDGKHDKRTVFWDKGDKLTSVAVGLGGVWALCAPRLIFIPDKNRDDIPDGEPEVLLDGWNDNEVRHNIVNGLMWGPDGWLYGRHGIQATSNVGKPGASDAERTKLNCSIWRYHPVKRTFEVVCHGTTNSWGHDWDEHGQLFFINTVIGHLWHAIPGAHYRRMYGADFNPHLYGLIEQTADHFHWDTRKSWTDSRGDKPEHSEFGGGHAHCGLMIYQGDNWPEYYRGKLFTINFGGLRLNVERLDREGCTFVGKREPDILKTSDVWFRGIDLLTGADGGVYLSDWSDLGECHDHDGIHRTTGRIYKVTYGEPKKQSVADVGALSDAELVALISQPNAWYARAAQRNLQERAIAGKDLTAAAKLISDKLAAEENAVQRVRLLFALCATNNDQLVPLQLLLRDPSEHVRVQTILRLVEREWCDETTLREFARLAADDSSGLVRTYLASALQKLPLEARWPIAAQLAVHSEDSNDRVQPLMLWYGIEAAIPESPAKAVALAATTRIPLLRQTIARRLTGEIERDPATVVSLLEVAARSDEAIAARLLLGMQEALRGRRSAPKPRNWDTVAEKFRETKNDDIAKFVRELAVVFGDGRGLEDVRKVAADANADAVSRREAIRVLVTAKADGLLGQLKNWLNDRVVETEAVRGLAAYDDASIAPTIVDRYNRLHPDSRPEAINTLCSRATSAAALLKGIADGKVPRRDVTAFHARQLLTLGDANLAKQLSEVWGDVRESDTEKQAQIAKYREYLTPERLKAANLSQGRVHFNKMCANCHVLYGQGKQVGPDLTGSNRANLNYLLENMVDPSAIVGVDFRMQILRLKDDRVLNGVIAEQAEKTLTVQTQTERVVIDRGDLEEQKATNLSLMPERQLNALTDEQVRDLVGYLQSRGQVPLPE